MGTGPRLVVLRGNAAVGKTTLAARLQRALGPRTANIGQDHFRRVVTGEHDVLLGDNIGLIANTIRYCAGLGYDVIAEGIFVAKHYRNMLEEVIGQHPGPVHLFYLEVPLEETLRRHAGRLLADEIPADLIRSWYVPSDTLGVPSEVVLDGTAELGDILHTILDTVGPATPAGDPDRYL